MKTIRLRVQEIDPIDGTSGHWFGRAHIVTRAADDRFDHGTILLSRDCRSSAEIISAANRLIRT